MRLRATIQLPGSTIDGAGDQDIQDNIDTVQEFLGMGEDRFLKWTPVSRKTTTKPADQYDNGANFLHSRPRVVSVRRRVKREDVESAEQVGVVGIKIEGQIVRPAEVRENNAKKEQSERDDQENTLLGLRRHANRP